MSFSDLFFKQICSRTTATTTMALFDEVVLYLGILERKIILMVSEARACTEYGHFEKEYHCIGDIG